MITYEGNIGVISPVDAIKNALLLGLDVALIRARHYNEDVQKCVNNSIIDGMEMRQEIEELAEICNKIDKDITIIPYNEFRDGFLPYKSLTANEGLLLHTFTLQSRDSTYDSSLYTYPVALEHKCKDSIIEEVTYINDINVREDPTKPFKVYSKKYKAFVHIVLFLEFISMDQLEKRSYTLFADGNSKFGATYAWSCCYDNIAEQLVLCKRYNNKSLNGKDNNTCGKC